MAWAYVWAVVFGGGRGGKLFVPAVLMLGVIPDVDLFLQGFGVVHHTFTHSLVFWFVMFAPFFVVFRLKSVPYFAAVVQHFAFGDFLVGNVMIFWPFSELFFGYNIAMPSVFDVALEMAGLLLAAGIVFFGGGLRRLLLVDKRNVLMLFPFLALVASMLFFAVDWPIVPLIAYVWSSKSLTIIVLGHVFLAIFLAVSTAQGLRRLFTRRRKLPA
jgi:hypothetical protein